MEFHAIPNAGVKAGSGAGIQAAQTLSNEGVEAVIGTNFGPNAIMTLKYAGMKTFSGNGTISQVIEQFKKGELVEVQNSNVPRGAGQFRR
jgi:predicted Fe-Mo cluster-binding NifX family protein